MPLYIKMPEHFRHAIITGDMNEINKQVSYQPNLIRSRCDYYDDVAGLTVLHLATQSQQNIEVLRYFLNQAGAKITDVTNRDENVLHQAIYCKRIDIVNLIMNLHDGKSSNIALAYAESIQICLNQKNKDGLTPLHFAALSGNYDIFKILKSVIGDTKECLPLLEEVCETVNNKKYSYEEMLKKDKSLTLRQYYNIIVQDIIMTKKHVIYKYIENYENVELVNLGLDDAAAIKLIYQFPTTNHHIKKLSFAGNNWGSSVAETIADHLFADEESIKQIQYERSIQSTAKKVDEQNTGWKGLVELDISHNKFGHTKFTSGAQEIFAALTEYNSLKKINAVNCHLDSADLRSLAQLVELNQNIEEIDIRDNLFNEMDLEVLVEAIQNNINIKDVALSPYLSESKHLKRIKTILLARQYEREDKEILKGLAELDKNVPQQVAQSDDNSTNEKPIIDESNNENNKKTQQHTPNESFITSTINLVKAAIFNASIASKKIRFISTDKSSDSFLIEINTDSKQGLYCDSKGRVIARIAFIDDILVVESYIPNLELSVTKNIKCKSIIITADKHENQPDFTVDKDINITCCELHLDANIVKINSHVTADSIFINSSYTCLKDKIDAKVCNIKASTYDQARTGSIHAKATISIDAWNIFCEGDLSTNTIDKENIQQGIYLSARSIELSGKNIITDNLIVVAKNVDKLTFASNPELLASSLAVDKNTNIIANEVRLLNFMKGKLGGEFTVENNLRLACDDLCVDGTIQSQNLDLKSQQYVLDGKVIVRNAAAINTKIARFNDGCVFEAGDLITVSAPEFLGVNGHIESKKIIFDCGNDGKFYLESGVLTGDFLHINTGSILGLNNLNVKNCKITCKNSLKIEEGEWELSNGIIQANEAKINITLHAKDLNVKTHGNTSVYENGEVISDNFIFEIDNLFNRGVIKAKQKGKVRAKHLIINGYAELDSFKGVLKGAASILSGGEELSLSALAVINLPTCVIISKNKLNLTSFLNINLGGIKLGLNVVENQILNINFGLTLPNPVGLFDKLTKIVSGDVDAITNLFSLETLRSVSGFFIQILKIFVSKLGLILDIVSAGYNLIMQASLIHNKFQELLIKAKNEKIEIHEIMPLLVDLFNVATSISNLGPKFSALNSNQVAEQDFNAATAAHLAQSLFNLVMPSHSSNSGLEFNLFGGELAWMNQNVALVSLSSQAYANLAYSISRSASFGYDESSVLSRYLSLEGADWALGGDKLAQNIFLNFDQLNQLHRGIIEATNYATITIRKFEQHGVVDVKAATSSIDDHLIREKAKYQQSGGSYSSDNLSVDGIYKTTKTENNIKTLTDNGSVHFESANANVDHLHITEGSAFSATKSILQNQDIETSQNSSFKVISSLVNSVKVKFAGLTEMIKSDLSILDKMVLEKSSIVTAQDSNINTKQLFAAERSELNILNSRLHSIEMELSGFMKMKNFDVDVVNLTLNTHAKVKGENGRLLANNMSTQVESHFEMFSAFIEAFEIELRGFTRLHKAQILFEDIDISSIFDAKEIMLKGKNLHSHSTSRIEMVDSMIDILVGQLDGRSDFDNDILKAKSLVFNSDARAKIREGFIEASKLILSGWLELHNTDLQLKKKLQILERGKFRADSVQITTQDIMTKRNSILELKNSLVKSAVFAAQGLVDLQQSHVESGAVYWAAQNNIKNSDIKSDNFVTSKTAAVSADNAIVESDRVLYQTKETYVQNTFAVTSTQPNEMNNISISGPGTFSTNLGIGRNVKANNGKFYWRSDATSDQVNAYLAGTGEYAEIKPEEAIAYFTESNTSLLLDAINRDCSVLIKAGDVRLLNDLISLKDIIIKTTTGSIVNDGHRIVANFIGLDAADSVYNLNHGTIQGGKGENHANTAIELRANYALNQTSYMLADGNIIIDVKTGLDNQSRVITVTVSHSELQEEYKNLPQSFLARLINEYQVHRAAGINTPTLYKTTITTTASLDQAQIKSNNGIVYANTDGSIENSGLFQGVGVVINAKQNFNNRALYGQHTNVQEFSRYNFSWHNYDQIKQTNSINVAFAAAVVATGQDGISVTANQFNHVDSKLLSSSDIHLKIATGINSVATIGYGSESTYITRTFARPISVGNGYQFVFLSLIAGNNIIAEAGGQLNVLGMTWAATDFLGMSAYDINIRALETLHRGRFALEKDYHAAMVIGGTGENHQGIGAAYIAQGMLSNIGSIMGATGSVVIDAKQGLRMEALSYTYLANQWEKKTGWFSRRKMQLYDTKYQIATVYSSDGSTYINSDMGGMYFVGTNVMSRYGNYLTARDNILLLDKPLYREIYASEKGLLSSSIYHRYQQFGLPSTITSLDAGVIDIKSQHDFLMRGSMLFNPMGETKIDAENISVLASIYLDKVKEESRGFKIKLLGIEIGGNNTYRPHFSDPLLSHANRLFHSKDPLEIAINVGSTFFEGINTINTFANAFAAGPGAFATMLAGRYGIIPNFETSLGWYQSRTRISQQVAAPSQIITGDLMLNGKDKIQIIGSPIMVARNADIYANEFDLLGIKLFYSYDHDDFSVTVTPSMSHYVDVGLAYSKQKVRGSTTEQQTMYVGDKFTFHNIKHMKMQDAYVVAEEVDGYVDELDMVSTSDTQSIESLAVSASTTGSFGFSSSSSSEITINKQTELHAHHINLEGDKLQLTSAKVTSESGQLNYRVIEKNQVETSSSSRSMAASGSVQGIMHSIESIKEAYHHIANLDAGARPMEKAQSFFPNKSKDETKRIISEAHFLSEAIYDKDNGKQIAARNGFELMDRYHDADTDTTIGIYRNDVTREQFIVFEGTNDLAAFKDNYQIASGNKPASMNQGMFDFMQSYVDANIDNGYTTYLSGHSRGAAQAALISDMYGFKAIVFDNPGILNNDKQYDFSNVLSVQSSPNMVNQLGDILHGDYDQGMKITLPSSIKQALGEIALHYAKAATGSVGLSAAALLGQTLFSHKVHNMGDKLREQVNESTMNVVK